ncbi:hypothetical protein AYW79_05805 [Ferroacidibacillus organovorans]|uniref:DUF983 domain-containing protein n=1 Tax=Ferroacidibacillus organovorans TaxID=1765683 RepID=A0A853KC06_9BACL|nr:hypothetical protein AYJ22_04985 [Ferroacidibacillus organovorans]OAG94377.1 hypothetical protein AYW79_05805 [Ferroacidibacillus organovorans]
MSKPVYCNRCTNTIEYREDLIICFNFIKLSVYHNECYSEELKGVSGLFLNNPINSLSWTLAAFILLPLTLFFSFISHQWILMALPLIVLFIRYLSWYLFEKNLS